MTSPLVILLLGVGMLLLGSSSVGFLKMGGVPALREYRAYTRSDKYAERQRLQKVRREAAREQKKYYQRVKRTAKGLRVQIIQHLASMGFLWVYERQGATQRSSKIGIKTVLYTKEAIYYRIDKLPFKVNYSDLLEPQVKQDLSLRIGREVRWIMRDTGPSYGLWLKIDLLAGVSGIPRLFPWYDDTQEKNALELLPKTMSLAIPIGAGENGKFRYENLPDLPHLVVCGATDGGKSVFLNQMLCTLISRNSPDHLKILLIDLKGGVEFTDYENIPHLTREPIIYPHDVPEALSEIERLCLHRFDQLRKDKSRKISIWNKKHPSRRMNYVLIVFDEIAPLMRAPAIRSKVLSLLTVLTAQGRAAGIHAVLCTQQVRKEVLSGDIMANITKRIVFRTDANSSGVALGGSHAAYDLPAIQGRAIWSDGKDKQQLQCPFISDQQIAEAIKKATGAGVAPSHVDLFSAIWRDANGKFTRGLAETLSKEYELGISRDGCMAIARDMLYTPGDSSKVIETDDGRFVLVSDNHPKGPKYMMPINGHLPDMNEVSMFVDGWRLTGNFPHTPYGESEEEE